MKNNNQNLFYFSIFEKTEVTKTDQITKIQRNFMIDLLLTIILLNIHVVKSLNCKPMSYESQSQKYIQVDWTKEYIGVMDACIWAIDPFGVERSEVTSSSSLNGNQNNIGWQPE